MPNSDRFAIWLDELSALTVAAEADEQGAFDALHDYPESVRLERRVIAVLRNDGRQRIEAAARLDADGALSEAVLVCDHEGERIETPIEYGSGAYRALRAWAESLDV